MALDWWEYYEMNHNIKNLRKEISRLEEQVKKLRKEVEEMKSPSPKGRPAFYWFKK
jgi:predicted nuclease with TOPRIM domain